MDKDALIAETTAAFDGVSREGGVSLREGNVIDACGSDKKRAAARRQDTETCWQDVPDADIAQFYSSLFFLDAIGLRYYLPAFMIYGLRHIDNDEWGIVSALLTVLQAAQSTGKPSWEPYKLITSTQVQAIGSFLQYVVAHGDEFDCADVAKCLSDYWNRYL